MVCGIFLSFSDNFIRCDEFKNVVREFIDVRNSVEELKKVAAKLDLAKKVGNTDLRENVANIEDDAEKMEESLPDLNTRLYEVGYFK